MPIALISDPIAREILHQIDRRTAAVERTDPSTVALGTLPSDLDANGQRVTAIGRPVDNQDLVALVDLQTHLAMRITQFVARYRVAP